MIHGAPSIAAETEQVSADPTRGKIAQWRQLTANVGRETSRFSTKSLDFSRNQDLRVEVRLPQRLADKAVAAWQRDESGDADMDNESSEQAQVRTGAGTLGLIGLSLGKRECKKAIRWS